MNRIMRKTTKLKGKPAVLFKAHAKPTIIVGRSTEHILNVKSYRSISTHFCFCFTFATPSITQPQGEEVTMGTHSSQVKTTSFCNHSEALQNIRQFESCSHCCKGAHVHEMSALCLGELPFLLLQSKDSSVQDFLLLNSNR